MSKMNIRETIGCVLSRLRKPEDKLNFKGMFKQVEHWRDGKLLKTYSFPNAVKDAAVNSLFDTMFNGASQVSSGNWCFGLIDNASFSAEAAADTMASHSGWIEFTGYSESTRVAWGQGSASARAVTNSAAAVFDITASSATLYGIFVTSNNTKSGTSGLLWTSGSFPSSVPVVSGDQIKIIYAIAA